MANMTLYPLHKEILQNIDSCATVQELLKKSKITKQYSRIRRAVSELKANGYLREGIHYMGKVQAACGGMHSTQYFEKDRT